MALVGLRIALYLQFLLGLIMLLGRIGGPGIRNAHAVLSILIAASTVLILRPLLSVPNDWVRKGARFAPLSTLAISLAMSAGNIYGVFVGYVHVALGIATIGLVEAASARQRRTRR